MGHNHLCIFDFFTRNSPRSPSHFHLEGKNGFAIFYWVVTVGSKGRALADAFTMWEVTAPVRTFIVAMGNVSGAVWAIARCVWDLQELCGLLQPLCGRSQALWGILQAPAGLHRRYVGCCNLYMGYFSLHVDCAGTMWAVTASLWAARAMWTIVASVWATYVLCGLAQTVWGMCQPLH